MKNPEFFDESYFDGLECVDEETYNLGDNSYDCMQAAVERIRQSFRTLNMDRNWS